MIIGIDGNEANVTKRVGISEYAFELLSQFSSAKLKAQSAKFLVYLKNEPLKSLPKTDNGWSYRVLRPGKLWTQWRLPLDLYTHQSKPDVFFSPTHYAPRFSPIPTVVSIMDLSFLNYPEMFKKSDLYQLRSWTAYSVKKAKKIFTISNSSKNDIINEYKIPEDKVVVTYPGIKEITAPKSQAYGMSNLKEKYGISDSYILFVGTLQPRKNIVRLIEAFSRVKRTKNQEPRTKDLQLIVIGKKGWLYEEILEAPEKFGVPEDVRFLHDVADAELAVFYNHALCYVLPSLYEGFGLPVLEAFQHGCPVITSNISSLPEVGGDAALYVDPKSVGDIAEKIMKLITNDNLRNELVEKGKKQVAKFSWEKTAKETLKVLEDVARIS